MSEYLDREQLELLQSRVRKLEERVERLERGAAFETEPASASAAPTPLLVTPTGETVVSSTTTLGDTANAVPILGRSLLALAGAYLLRALTEMGVAPPAFGAAAGVAYATAWLAFAARAPRERKLASIMYSLASVLVLTPLVWEATVRFHAFPTSVSALVLTGFTLLGLALSWKHNLTYIAWIATLAGVLTACGLLFATFDLMPFTYALLAIAAAVEISACLEHWLKERLLVAMAANLAVLIATFIVSRPAGIPESYVPFTLGQVVGAQVVLLAIYTGGAIFRTLWRRLPFASAEVFQCAMAFAVGVGGGLWAARGTGIETAFATFTVLCALACYLVAFAFLDRRGEHGRNFYIYSTFGLLLAIGGSGALLAAPALGVALSVTAVAFTWMSLQWRRGTLRYHATAYLWLGAAYAGTLAAAFSLLASTASGWAAVPWGLVLTGACAGACCLMIWRRGDVDGAGNVPMVTIATMLLTGIAAGLVTSILPADKAAYAATLRTALILGAAAALARTRGAAFRWTAVAAMALGGVKLLAQEFRANATMPLVISLLLYGGMLLVMPRLYGRGASSSNTAS